MKFILSFLCLLLVQVSLQKKLHITKVEIDIDPKYFMAKSVVKSDGEHNVIDMDLDVLEDSNEINFRLTIFQNKKDHYEIFYRSEVVQGCHKEEIKDPALIIVFKELDKFGNVTKACPMKKGHYALRGFRIDASELSHDLPEGEYRVDFHASMKINGHDHPVYTDRYFLQFIA